MKEHYEPVIHWLTHEEALARQVAVPVCPGRSSHSDPTANAAIGRMYRQEKSHRGRYSHEKHDAHRKRGGSDRWAKNRRRM